MEQYLQYCVDGIKNIKSKNYNVAINCFDNSVLLKPDYYLAYRERGLAKYYANIEQGENNFHLNNSFKKAFQLMNNGGFNNIYGHDNAKEDINKAIKLNPNDYKAYFYMAKMLKTTVEANEYFDKSINLNPDFLNAYIEKYIRNGDSRMTEIANATYNEIKKKFPFRLIKIQDINIAQEKNYYYELITEIKEYKNF